MVHIPGSINISLDEHFDDCVRTILEPLPIVVIADDLNEIEMATTKLTQLGFADVKGFLYNGIDVWLQEKVPTVRTDLS